MKTSFKLGPFGNHAVGGLVTELHWGSAAFTDLNGDGFDDLIQTGSYYPNEAYPSVDRSGFVLFGTAAGFVPATPTQVPLSALLDVHAREFAFADFNQDGIEDFFIADHGYDANPFPGHQNVLYLSSQTGTGTRWLPSTSNLPQLSDFSHSVTVGDVNRDNHVDIFVGNGGLADAYFLLGDGSGGFTSNKSMLPTTFGGALAGVSIGFTSSLLSDLDLDGWPDLVLGTGSQSSTHQLFWSNGGSFASTAGGALPAPQNFGNGWSVMDVQAVDMNFDGLPDLVVDYQADVLNGGWLLQVLINQGNRNFVDETSKYISNAAVRSGGNPAQGGEPAWIEFLLPRDVNNDGRMDFVIESKAWGKPLPDSYPLVLLHQADGSFDPLTAGDLRGAGLPAFILDNSLHYVARGPSQNAELVQLYRQSDGGVAMNEQSIAFATAATYWSAGSNAADTLAGTTGADEIAGFGGNDAISGGAGIDTARYNARLADAVLQKAGNGWTITSTADGKDTLTSIERLTFADTHLAIDLDGNAGSVAKILGAVFGKQYLSNQEFVGIGLNLLDKGTSYADLVKMAVGTDVFAQLAGSHSNVDLVNCIYKNVVGVLPNQATLNSYVSMLDSGAQTQASLALMACETDINKLHIDLVGLSASGIAFTPTA